MITGKYVVFYIHNQHREKKWLSRTFHNGLIT